MSTNPEPRSRPIRRTIGGAAWLSMQPLVLNALSIPAIGYIIHRLGAEQYAQWMTATALLAVCAIITNLGLRTAFVRSVAADPAAARGALADQMGLRLVLSLVAGVVVIGACLALGYSSTVLWCAALGCVGLVLTTIATTMSDCLQALQKIRPIAIVAMVSGVVLTATSVVVAWRGGGAEAIAAAYVVGPVLSVVGLARLVRKSVGKVEVRFNRGRFVHLIRESRHFAAQQVLFAGSSQAEALLVPRMLGMVSFGHFTAGALLPNRLSVLPDAFCSAAFPTMVEACKGGSRSATGLVLKYLAIAVASGIVVAAAGMFVAEPLGRLLVPEHAAMVASVVRVTMWCLPLAALELVMGYALYAAGKEATQARLAVPAAVVGLLAAVALISAFGVVGACWSMVLRPTIRAMFLLPTFVRTFLFTTASAGAVAVTLSAQESLRKAG